MLKGIYTPIAFCLVFYAAIASDKPTYLEPAKHAKTPVETLAMTTEEACLSIAVDREARNQSIRGQLMVLGVVFNRMKKLHKSACQVITQKGQFSWVRGKKSLTPTKESVKMLPIVRQAFADRGKGTFVDYSRGATHFHTKAIRPWWSSPKHTIKVVEHQAHIFYKVRNT